MRPKFSNLRLRTLWYVLYYGSAVVAGATIAMYKNGVVDKAAMIAIIVTAIAVFAAMFWWAYRIGRKEAEAEIIDEKQPRIAKGIKNDNGTPQRVNIYGIKMPSTTAKVVMEALTLLLLVATWVILWAQHKLAWGTIISPLVMTVASIGALAEARFPFLMSDAEKHKDINQISFSVKKQQVYALVFAAMAVISPLFDIKWTLLGLLVVFCIVETLFERKNKSGTSLDQRNKTLTGERFNANDIQVERNMETIAFEVVTGLLIVAALCITVLSYDAIKNDLMRYSTRVMFILGLAFLAISQLVKAVKFAKADKDLKNVRQFSLAVRENRVYGIEFAFTSLIVAISIKHHIIDASVFLIVVLAMFFGTYSIFMNSIKKANSHESDE